MNPNGKNKRDVCNVPSQKVKGLYSAVMPVSIAETCVLACSEPADVVLDPFCGTVTTGVAALIKRSEVPWLRPFSPLRSNIQGLAGGTHRPGRTPKRPAPR